MNPYIILAAVLALVGATGGGYWWGSSAKENAILADQKREDKLIEKVQTTVAKSIAGIEVKNVTIRQRTERETRVVPDYSQCHHSDVGLRNVNAALSNAEPPGDRELPGADATR